MGVVGGGGGGGAPDRFCRRRQASGGWGVMTAPVVQPGLEAHPQLTHRGLRLWEAASGSLVPTL